MIECKYPDLMIDIEGLGKSEGSIICQIAAIPFNILTGGVSSSVFDVNIDILKSYNLGFTMDASTVLWWLNQSKEAQDSVFNYTEYNQEGWHPYKTLERLTCFVEGNCTPDVNVWQHTNYDAKLLGAAYTITKAKPFFNYRSWKDIRTLVALTDDFDVDFEGIPHNALDDCKYQIKYCVGRYNQIEENGYE